MVELDVHLNRDGDLIVIHDADLERTTDGIGAVRDHSTPQLKQLDAGAWFGEEFSGSRVLTLDEVIALLPSNVALNVEIKSVEQDWAGTASALIHLLETTNRVSTTIVSSFLYGALEAVRGRSNEIQIGLLTYTVETADCFQVASRLTATAVHPYFAFVDDNLVSECHRRGLRVNTWTVNDPDCMRTLLASDVDGIISDYPDVLRDVMLGSDGNG